MIFLEITEDSVNQVHRPRIDRCHRYSMEICFTRVNSELIHAACIVIAIEDSQMEAVCSEMA